MTARISRGMVVFVAVEKGDTVDAAGSLARRLVDFRIFGDDKGKMNLSVKEVEGEILIVPEFTLAADVRKGTRPSFDRVESPERARELVADFTTFLKNNGLPVKEGVFGAHMVVSVENDGPVTFLL